MSRSFPQRLLRGNLASFIFRGSRSCFWNASWANCVAAQASKSLAYVAEGEKRVDACREPAAQEALRALPPCENAKRWIGSSPTSETHHDYPSLSAQLHSRIAGARELRRTGCWRAPASVCLNALAVTQIADRIGAGADRSGCHRRRPQAER